MARSSPDVEAVGMRLDVVRDRHALVGCLPIGHGTDPIAIPLGTTATLDADAGTLRVRSAACRAST